MDTWTTMTWRKHGLRMKKWLYEMIMNETNGSCSDNRDEIEPMNTNKQNMNM